MGKSEIKSTLERSKLQIRFSGVVVDKTTSRLLEKDRLRESYARPEGGEVRGGMWGLGGRDQRTFGGTGRADRGTRMAEVGTKSKSSARASKRVLTRQIPLRNEREN